jgi:DNA-binding NtrC family response regulator
MSEKVLLVDDETDFLEVMSERMKTRGLDVSTSTSAKEALKQAQEGNYDAVVLDLMMPEMDGIEALSALKEKHPELQVILLTGHGSVEKGVEAMKLGAMDFLEKPIDLNALTEKIKQAKAQKMVLVDKKTEQKLKDIMTKKGW